MAESVKYIFTAKMQCESKVFDSMSQTRNWSVNPDYCLNFQHSKGENFFREVAHGRRGILDFING